MRVIPVETVLVCQIESIREVASGGDRVLSQKLATYREYTKAKI